ncbi:hypothetical protein ACLKA6_016863 [Drosophila palustris]
MSLPSGVYEILIPSYSEAPFKVRCDSETRKGGWTVILRRFDGSVNFYRNWKEYKNGFGDLNGEFFLGLDKIYALTSERRQELRVVLEDFEGTERFEQYDRFAIGDEDEQYELKTLGNATGDARDGLRTHLNKKFSTYNQDNDMNPDQNFARIYKGAWWYKSGLQYSSLTGKYNDNSDCSGIHWTYFRGDKYSLKRAVMMIRPHQHT